jgi:hypothetical protein
VALGERDNALPFLRRLDSGVVGGLGYGMELVERFTAEVVPELKGGFKWPLAGIQSSVHARSLTDDF